MSLIHACELNAANPFELPPKLQRQPNRSNGASAEWMPWNYHEQLPAGGDIDCLDGGIHP
jgi:hypothetical protein